MRITCVAFGVLCLAFFAHWVIWQIRIPKRQSAVILAIFLGVLPISLAASRVPLLFKMAGPLGFWQYLHVAFFQIAMSLGYVVAYSALEERSPSMTVLAQVANRTTRGCTRAEITEVLRGALPVERRLLAMVRDNMVEEVDGSYRLTRKGQAWVAVFSTWRRFLRMEKGG